jgi:hypothetical protein
MKRIHYLLLGLLVSLTIAAVSPGLPPTRIAPGANTTVVTNGINSFTISSSAGGAGAQLDGTNVFTGTNTFPAASFYPANSIGRRLLFTTNIFIPTIAVVASDATNNGDYANVTQLFKVTLPALLSSNSMVVLSVVSVRTNANAVGAQIVNFVGSTTNFIGNGSAGSGGSGTAVGKTASSDTTVLLANWISFTNQIQGGSGALINTPTNFVDTSTSWDLMVGFYVLTTAYTNHWATYSYYEIIGQ